MSLFSVGTKLLRKLPAEEAHKTTIRALKTGLVLAPHRPPLPNSLRVTLPKSGLILSNPVGLAAGFDKDAEAFRAMFDFGFGMVECGTVTPRPQKGNPKPRLFRLPEDKAVINRMGFNNGGLAAFAARISRHDALDGILGANVGANKDSEDRVADYVAGIKAVYAYADYVTINISSPNTPGLRGLQDRDALETLLTACGDIARQLGQDLEVSKPLFLKVAPDLDDEAIADISGVVEAQADWLKGLIVSNTTIARPDSLQNKNKGEGGGLSGAPLMAPSTEILRKFAGRLFGKVDLIGVGGIGSGADAYEKIKAGAHAVQLYSMLVYEGPVLADRINRELADLLKADGFDTVAEAAGSGL